MNTTKSLFLLLFLSLGLSLSGQKLTKTSSKVVGPKLIAGPECYLHTITFYTTQVLPNGEWENTEIDAYGTNVIYESNSKQGPIPYPNPYCDIYAYSFDVRICCIDCPAGGPVCEVSVFIDFSVPGQNNCVLVNPTFFDSDCLIAAELGHTVTNTPSCHNEVIVEASNCHYEEDPDGSRISNEGTQYSLTTSGNEQNDGAGDSNTVILDFENKEVITDNAINIFPSPAYSVLNISNTKAGDIVTITDLNGRLVKEKSVFDSKLINLDIGEMQSGVYLLRVKHANAEITTKKFIKS